MRILMLNNEFPPLGGGTGTVNRILLQHLEHVPGLYIDLITSGLGRRAECEQFAGNVQIFKVPVNNENLHHSSNRELGTFARRALPLALERHRAKRYDFCFAWSAVPAGGVALGLWMLARLPFIVRVCGPDIPGFERRYTRLYPFLTPLIRMTWRAAQTVVAKCEHEAEMIRAVDRKVSISLIPNGVDLDAFKPGVPIPDSGPLRVLCVGRLIERKGQHHLIQAVKRLSDQGIDVVLELVGTGDAEDEYKAQVQALGIADRVHFRGYVPREEIAEHYAAAHVFVLPSYNEGMSVATLEAMATGLPIITTRTSATGLVEEGVNGLLFDWADVDTLSMHLSRLANDRSVGRGMGVSSRSRANQNAWERAVEAYLALFQLLAGGETQNLAFGLAS